MPFFSPNNIGDSNIRLGLLRAAQAKAHEAKAQALLPPHTLMARAGEAVARLSLAKFPYAQRVLILCGAGNNGGDGFVAARWLQSRGISVEVLALPATTSDSDVAWARVEWLTLGQLQVLDVATLGAALTRCDLVIDALWGAGLNKPLSAAAQVLISTLNTCAKPIVAVDLPSGLQADTGCILGACVKADVTLALLCLRPGHFTGDAKAHTGELWFHDLDIPRIDYHQEPYILSTNTITLPAVSPITHKGQRGVVGVIGGATGMRGAPLLSARAALHLGAGRVHVGFIADAPNEPTPPLDATEPSLMCHAVTRQVWPFEADVWVFGPGAGMGEDATHVLNVLLAHTHDQPLVLDADGLNLLATHTVLIDALHARSLPAVLTPHPLEAARLLGCTTAQVQADRVTAAVALATRYQSVVVLKGAGTVIADAKHQVAINPTGGAWLSTAGSGDVLAGVIAAFMAQGLSPFEAACSAVYIHGSPYNIRVVNDILPVVATDQITAMPAELRKIQHMQTSQHTRSNSLRLPLTLAPSSST